MAKALLVIGILSFLFLSACAPYKEVYEDTSLKLSLCQTKLNLINTTPQNITETIYINQTCEECPICDTNISQQMCDEGYLTFDEYQKMSLRIKSLHNRLKSCNNTDLMLDLEDNSSRYYAKWLKCNSTLMNISSLLD